MQKLNKIQQRWLALGLLLAIIILIITLIFIPWYSALQEKLDEIDEHVFQIKRYERVIASRDDVLNEVQQGREQINSLNYFYKQETHSLASAELQKRVREIAQQAGGEISSTQVLPRKEQDGLIRIAVKVKLLGDMEMLRTLLYEIEAENPLMSIEDLTVIPRRGKRNRKTRKIEETGKVTVNLEVSGYMRKKSDETN